MVNYRPYLGRTDTVRSSKKNTYAYHLIHVLYEEYPPDSTVQYLPRTQAQEEELGDPLCPPGLPPSVDDERLHRSPSGLPSLDGWLASTYREGREAALASSLLSRPAAHTLPIGDGPELGIPRPATAAAGGMRGEARSAGRDWLSKGEMGVGCDSYLWIAGESAHVGATVR